MIDAACFNSLLERAADAMAPEQSLFVEVFFACAEKQHLDIKGRFALLMEAGAWTEAALILKVYTLPGWQVQTKKALGLVR